MGLKSQLRTFHIQKRDLLTEVRSVRTGEPETESTRGGTAVEVVFSNDARDVLLSLRPRCWHTGVKAEPPVRSSQTQRYRDRDRDTDTQAQTQAPHPRSTRPGQQEHVAVNSSGGRQATPSA